MTLSNPSRKSRSAMPMQTACITAALAAIALVVAGIIPATLQAQARPKLGKFLFGADITGIETTAAGAPIGYAGGGAAGGAPGGGAAPVRTPFTYQEDGKPSDELTILHNHGWNAFRVRIFVPPVRNAPNNPLENAVPLCKRIKALGDKLLLCVHFSDTWTDPGKQFIPVAWQGEDINGLEKEWEKHAYEVVKTLKDAGAMPDMIQIGNEITNGTAWPIARVQFPGNSQTPPPQGYDDAKQWDNLTRLLKAGGQGRESGGGQLAVEDRHPHRPGRPLGQDQVVLRSRRSRARSVRHHRSELLSAVRPRNP